MNGSTPTRNRSPSPASSRSFLSKLKSPFGSKARNVTEFFVQPDDPHRQYAPGDIITGSVVLKILKPLRITHLIVCLHGYVHVYKTPNSPGEGYRAYSIALAQGKTRKGGGYYGNGFASLFEDEVVLCGDGRLGEGTYQFNFELQLPRERLPSSIDFERGKICYMITATLTRPTAIAPTMSCDRRVDFQEQIDIAALYKPRPRLISLEPISRRGRSRRKPQAVVITSDQSTSTELGRISGESTTDQNTGDGVSVADAETPQSPSPSRVSFDSCNSSRETGSLVDSTSVSGRTGDSKLGRSKGPHNHLHQVLKPITAKIELTRAGFLRGDSIPVKIIVNHTKPVKSLHGVIVTFYRQARVDFHPNLTRIGAGKGDEDEIFPRSRTGLGSLSLSSGHGSHLFRKDLSQSFASLIINPSTLAAEVRATVRVPDGVFPSISNVPGAMISFRYYVEVVLDLQNKLAGLDRFLPNAGMSGVSTVAEPGAPAGTGASHSVFAPWGGHFIDTEEIRRDKSVVSCVFEVMIGTTDSERKGKWKAMAGSSEGFLGEPPDAQSTTIEGQRSRSDQEVPRLAVNGAARYTPPEPYRDVRPHPESPPPPIHAIPIPDLTSEENALSEKERLRRAEERLLPSRPPEEPGPSIAATSHLPSAPPMDHDEVPYHPLMPPAIEHLPSAPTASSLHAPSVPYPEEHDDSLYEPESSAPAYYEHAGPSSSTTAGGSSGSATNMGATDDKEELSRRQLHVDRSAPPVAVEGESSQSSPPLRLNQQLPESAPSVPNATEDAEASAPTMEELTLGFSTEEARHDHHPLPRYER